MNPAADDPEGRRARKAIAEAEAAQIAYWLLDAVGNEIVASGLATGRSEIRGKVGEALDLSVRT